MMRGLNAAQETLTSQAYGSGNLRLCGLYLNRGRFILTTFFIIFAILPSMFAEQIFLALKQDPEVSRLTQTQILVTLPSVFFYAQFDLYKKWLACQRITFVPLIAILIATSLHVPFCLLFVNYFNLDIFGLGLASSCKDLVLLSSVMIYGSCSKDISPVL